MNTKQTPTSEDTCLVDGIEYRAIPDSNNDSLCGTAVLLVTYSSAPLLGSAAR